MSERLPPAVRIAEWLRRGVDFIGRWGAWLSLPVIIVTCIDVVGRKLAYIDDETGRVHSLQLWLSANVGRFFDSTVLQELEWHFHAALFALVLGYGMVYNTHVRIDLMVNGNDIPPRDAGEAAVSEEEAAASELEADFARLSQLESERDEYLGMLRRVQA